MGAFVIIIIVVLIWYFGFHKKRRHLRKDRQSRKKFVTAQLPRDYATGFIVSFQICRGKKYIT